MRGLMYRVFLLAINILLPPLSVLMLCGADWDFVLNCCLFFLGIIPGHIHAFYISCTYFHRRHKVLLASVSSTRHPTDNIQSQVKKGRYPGGSKPLIKSKNVINGGASDREVEQLYLRKHGLGGGQRYHRGGHSYTKGSDMAQVYYG